MPLEVDVWKTLGLILPFSIVYLSFRCFGVHLKTLEGKVFKRSRDLFLAAAMIIEGFILFVAVSVMNAGLLSNEEGFFRAIALLHMIPLAMIASAISATLKKKYPEGLYEHLWFKYISGKPSQLDGFFIWKINSFIIKSTSWTLKWNLNTTPKRMRNASTKSG